MFRFLTLTTLTATAFAMAYAGPAAAQVNHDNMDHGKMDHAQMDHGDKDHGDMDHGDDHADHDHAGHDHDAMEPSEIVDSDVLRLRSIPELSAAMEAGGEPIFVKVLGVVCDFCAVAMNKTFGKHQDVAAVSVDLDRKTLNLVMKPGANMDDETLQKLVKKSGYKVESITRFKDAYNE